MNSATSSLCVLVRSLSGGGMERIATTLAAGFAQRGHPTTLLVAVPEGPMKWAPMEGVRLVPLAPSLPPVWRARVLAADPGAIRHTLPLVLGPSPRMLRHLPGLVRYLREERPRALLALGTQSNLTALWARGFGGIPTRIVISERNTLSQVARNARRSFRRAYPALARRVYPLADGIIAVSGGVAEDLARVAGLPPERIVTIHNPTVSPQLGAQAAKPVDHPWFDDTRPVILAAGRLHRQKDFPTLLRAFARLRAVEPARLIILGEGEERTALEKLVRSLGIADDVDLPGFVANPFAWMARARLFVLSSAWEGIANVVVEALACGCPVVSTDCPSGPREILEGGTYGALVPVGDEARLAEAILSALHEPVDRDRLRRHAARFDRETAIDHYVRVLLDTPGSTNT